MRLPSFLLILAVALSLSACNTFYDPSGDRPDGAPVDTSQDQEVDAPIDIEDQGDGGEELPETCGGETCEQGERCCDDACIPVLDDGENCGACGLICGNAETCVDGSCRCGDTSGSGAPACEGETTCCQDQCVAPDDPLCACGDAPPCEEGQLCCDDSCVDPQSTNDHCGACGEACPQGQACWEGDCQCESSELPNACGDSCVNLQDDTDNCGECEKVCNDFLGDASCAEGECQIACGVQHQDCDESADTGCETDTYSSVEHCGACENACSSFGGTPSCDNGTCSIACSPGASDCNSDPNDGCEVDLSTDSNNCGACENECAFGAACQTGDCLCDSAGDYCPKTGIHHSGATCDGETCTLACIGQYKNCNGDGADSCETNTNNDPTNCGACGQSCGIGASCVNGSCDAIVKLVAGDKHICALREEGRIICWGDGSRGQLGHNSYLPSAEPILVTISGATDYVAIDLDAGAYHTCAVLDNNRVWCWGDNDQGQLGDGNTGSDSRVAVRAGSNLTNATKVATGGAHTCALRSDGRVVCWGDGGHGQIGNGTANDYATQQVVSDLVDVSEIKAGYEHTCAIEGLTETLYCWGSNSNGQIGSGSGSVNITTPEAVVAGALPVSFTRNFSLGKWHTCGTFAEFTPPSTYTDFSYCWGENQNGQLGSGNDTDTNSAENPFAFEFTDFAAGVNHTCALTGTTAYCWGYNGAGALGDGTINSSNAPNLIDTTTGLAESDLMAAGEGFSCARNALNGTISCWGDGSSGQLGNGSFNSPVLTPGPVSNLP